MTLHVACGGSEEYLPHHATMLHSVIERAGSLDVVVHYLHGPALSPAKREGLRAMVERAGGRPRLLEMPDERISGLPAIENVPATMWYRAFLPELLSGVGRVLYLDADTLAVDDLAPLWETDMGGHPIAAVTNVWEPWNAGYSVALGLADEYSYFNSGVLLMDLAAMRAEDATGKLVAHARSRRDNWGDQDALNVVFAGRWLRLHPRWNAMNAVLQFPHAEAAFGAVAVAEARASPAIRHFEGPSINKPWHLLCEREGRRAYQRHRRATPWARYRPDGLTPRNVARRVVRDVRSAVRP